MGFYSRLAEKNGYSDELKTCIENTVIKLQDTSTSLDAPGMLLGKIQSGKTRAFIGIMANGFDKEYDIAIILTKGVKALAEQTIQRMKDEFSEFIVEDSIQIFDIISMPDNLVPFELDQKLIFVVKKEKNNLQRLNTTLFETYPQLKNRKIMIIDDEADFASIGFKRTKNETIEINTIAGQIDKLRQNLDFCSFLQVTATPYSLYLQPKDIVIGGSTFQPICPAFTELVPVHEKYIGGDYYFNESDDQESIASQIYDEVNCDELKIIKESDRRKFKIENALTSDRIACLRGGVINFIVGACIRRLQDGEKKKKYSFIVHTEQSRDAHEWQEKIVEAIKEQLTELITTDRILFTKLIAESYENLQKSLKLLNVFNISFEDVLDEVTKAMQEGYLLITKVNSENDVKNLLDASGQLKLRAPLNIYIGGQILDRGITIGNLIGFYYGRNPKMFQQDTVLQHSRMFGYRPLQDLAVTRFYTTRPIYDVMKKMHEFDTELRNAFEKGGQDNGVVFIQKDKDNKIVPCSPNKILLSSTTTLRPSKRLLPVGFTTYSKTKITKEINEIDKLLISGKQKEEYTKPFLMDVATARTIIEKIVTTFKFADGYQWDDNAFIASMEYLSKIAADEHRFGKVWVVVRTERKIHRTNEKGKFADAPDTPKGEMGELRIAKEIATDIPALILLRQEGLKVHDWEDAPFWWPVLVVPKNTKPVIFSGQTVG